MKTLVKVILVTSCLFLAACAKRQSAQDVLKDDKTREQIMVAICNDSNMTKEMVSHMNTTGASQRMLPMTCKMLDRVMLSNMMKEDTAIKNTVIGSMLDMIAKDSVLCDKTCDQMSQNPSIAKFLNKKR